MNKIQTSSQKKKIQNTFNQTFHINKQYHSNDINNPHDNSSSKLSRTNNTFKNTFNFQNNPDEQQQIKTLNLNRKKFHQQKTQLFDFQKEKEKSRDILTFQSSGFGDNSLDQFKDFTDYKNYQEKLIGNSEFRNNIENKNIKIQQLYSCIDKNINKKYLEQKYQSKQDQNNEILNKNQQNRRLIENYCTNIINNDKEFDENLIKKTVNQKQQQQQNKVSFDQQKIQKNNSFAFNKKVENIYKCQIEGMEKEEGQIYVKKSNDQNEINGSGMSVQRVDKRSKEDHAHDNWMSVTAKVPISNIRSTLNPFQTRQQFLQSSLDNHPYLAHSTKQTIHDFQPRLSAFQSRQAFLTHQHLGDYQSS